MKDQHSDNDPNWKRDFPIEKTKATHVSRREFAKFLGLLSGALAISNGGIVIKSLLFPKEGLKGEHFVCNVSDVAVGEMFQFEIEGTKVVPYILIRLEEDRWRAFEQKCTHLACAVRYRADLNQIECPCHQGFFDAESGRVIAGPPPRPLPQLAVIIREDKVYVTGKEEQEQENIS
ncbi:Rieske (2Fe-2S) protein [Aliifodinibius sp. S!AR15-10]|uniref:QcrA and Rieske domain-containing protein n=1 Tax=Aliifodinibius sp. S!AR15-10 TaxID=2950437 RepID=UPI00285FC17C|nr:Rieske (2Fe-2S) protein [Aliifodinibius sp. S!AR15-10]MDR8390718.1 Rieske (2Fe-2S) protein [Aliifodinibius sp. S!AR15-10]